MSAITLRVLTAEGIAVDDRAVSVQAPGEPGYLGVLRGHAPLVTTLRPGTLTWRRADGSAHVRSVGAGILEVEHDRLTILTESVREAAASA